MGGIVFRDGCFGSAMLVLSVLKGRMKNASPLYVYSIATLRQKLVGNTETTQWCCAQ